MRAAVTVGKSRAGRWGEKILMCGENLEEGHFLSSFVTQWPKSNSPHVVAPVCKKQGLFANFYLQSNQGLFCLWQYSTVTKKAAGSKSCLKLASNLKKMPRYAAARCAGWKGRHQQTWLGWAQNRFNGTFSARSSKQQGFACLQILQRVISTVCRWWPGWSFALVKVRREGVSAFNLQRGKDENFEITTDQRGQKSTWEHARLREY